EIARHLLCHISILTLILVYIGVFFFNDPATPNIYTLSLHDALPISATSGVLRDLGLGCAGQGLVEGVGDQLADRVGHGPVLEDRSEEHTSELQSRGHLVCRLLLEKKKT